MMANSTEESTNSNACIVTDLMCSAFENRCKIIFSKFLPLNKEETQKK